MYVAFSYERARPNRVFSLSLQAIKKLFDMIVSILHNIAQAPELVNDLRSLKILEVCEKHVETISPLKWQGLILILGFESTYSKLSAVSVVFSRESLISPLPTLFAKMNVLICRTPRVNWTHHPSTRWNIVFSPFRINPLSRWPFEWSCHWRRSSFEWTGGPWTMQRSIEVICGEW